MAQAAAIAGIVGAGMQLVGSIQGGMAADAAGKYKAKQLTQLANDAVAEGQITAQGEKRQADLLASRARVLAAASGGSGGNIDSILSDIDSMGKYRVQAALYEGDSKARQLRMGADAARFEGKQAKQNAIISGLAGAGMSAYQLYGQPVGGKK